MENKTTISMLALLAFASASHAASTGFEFHPVGNRWEAANRGFRAVIGGDAIRLVPSAEDGESWSLGLRLLRYGRPGLMAPALRGSVSSPTKRRVEIDRAGLVEWYVNDDSALEQGFDLPFRPGGPAGLELVFEIGLTTDLIPVFSPDGRAVEFFRDGRLALRYAKLVVIDATGFELQARIEPFAGGGERGLRLIVDDRDALYPIVVDPVLGTESWSAYGPNAGSAFGASVASAGDVNGDGYGDVIVGSPNAENGQSNEGMAFVYLGSPAGLQATPVWSDEGDQANGLFGWSVATAGDVNGDGYADVIVGCGFCSGGGTWRGEAYLYYGSAAGPSAVPDQVLTGISDSDLFGLAVSTAGDFNGDGYSDVIVGAPGWNSSRGRAFLFSGSPAGLSQNLPVFEGQSNGGSFGQAVAGGGDVNGDGFGDVAVAAPNQGATSNDGRVFLMTGASAGVGQIHSRQNPSGATGSRFGAAIAFVGDTTGDGTSDLAVGAPNESDVDPPNPTTGRVYVFHTMLNDWWDTFVPDTGARAFGRSLAGAGDVNDDGLAEILVGDDQYLSGRGTAWLFRWPAPGVAANGRIWSPDLFADVDDLAGFGVAAADVNGDGRPEVIVGAIGRDDAVADDRGEVRVYHGASPTWPYLTAVETVVPAAGFTNTGATAIGDVNGDGYADVAVAEPDTQRVSVFLGSSLGFGAADWIDVGPSNSEFGSAVASAGDLNGDGYSDLLVGAPSYNGASNDEGRVFVYLGSPTGLEASPSWTYDGSQTDTFLGRAVAGLGDVNGDGYADVAVGAPNWTAGEALEGRVFVFHGSPSGLAATPDSIHEPDVPLAFFGATLDGAGDVNGDGYSDMIVGAEGYGVNGAGLVYLGGPAGLSPGPAWQGDLGLPVLAGLSVAGAGDVNGDGYADVAIGSMGYSNPELNEGAAAVFHGGPFGPSTVPDWFHETNVAGWEWGALLRGRGDLTGDGFADLLVGTGDGRDVRAYWGSAVGLTSASRDVFYNSGRLPFDGADVDGDGFVDLVFGANDGFGFLTLSNPVVVPDRRVRTRQPDDSAPIAPLGISDGAGEFAFRVAAPRWQGYGMAAVEAEVKPIGIPFDGTSTVVLPYRANFGPPAALETIAGLAPGTLVHWRTRHRFDIHANPFFAYGPWLPSPDNAWSEADLRTSGNAAAGAVPDGDTMPGAPMTVALSDDGQGGLTVTLEWSAACDETTTDYAVYIGTIGDFTSHWPMSCTTEGTTQYAYPPDPVTPQYYLVVPVNTAGQREGAYGVDSGGQARPASTSPCFPPGEFAVCN